MSDQEDLTDDGILINVAAELTRVAQITNEPRVIQLMTIAYDLLPPTAMATLMLRYSALKEREEELEREMEETQLTTIRQQMAG